MIYCKYIKVNTTQNLILKNYLNCIIFIAEETEKVQKKSKQQTEKYADRKAGKCSVRQNF